MARKKNYQASPVRQEQFRIPRGESAASTLSNSEDACIDMVALLGPGARFASSERNIHFTDWLGQGIDAWVFAVIACFRTMLRSGSRETSTVVQYAKSFRVFFSYLTEGRKTPCVVAPEKLSPLHVEAFVAWLLVRKESLNQTAGTTRTAFKNVKAVLLELFAQGHIPGEPTRFFKRGALSWRDSESRQTSLSDAEQERLATAIKVDLVAIHHGRLQLMPSDVQALRLLLVAHRQGGNPTPLLELHRDAMSPGLMPGTIRMRTVKARSRKVRSSVGRAAPGKSELKPDEAPAEIVLSLAEGAVLQQAITSTEELVKEAPVQYKNRVWLYRSHERGARTRTVTCLTTATLRQSINRLIVRHNLLSDNGAVLHLNLSRTRKSFFDRAFRNTDGDLAKTANLLGNTPRVAGAHYSSMNESRKAEAAEFMNEDYVDIMRPNTTVASDLVIRLKPVEVKAKSSTSDGPLEPTPVSSCKDTLNGEHAPRNGHNYCDRYVMCLFCSSFAIVGSVEELWRLFSFQAFAKAELVCLDEMLGAERTTDDELEDLRDRYRIAIPYIDSFTQRQFPARIIEAARARTEEALHPFWVHQMTLSRRARGRNQHGT